MMTTAVAERVAPTLRLAESNDVSALVALVRTFITTTAYRRFVGESPEHIERTVRWMLTNEDAAIFVALAEEQIIGLLGVVAFAHPLSGQREAVELFWWLNPDRRGWGGWLLRRAEKWARSRQCVALQMVAPYDNTHVQGMYRRVGYQPMEVAFQKDLQ